MQGCKAVKHKHPSILHDPHDLIEENPIGELEVAFPGTQGSWIYFHVLTVERDAVLLLQHPLKQLNLGERGSIIGVYVSVYLRRLTKKMKTERSREWAQKDTVRGENIFTQEAIWVCAPVWTGGICALTLGSTSQWQAAGRTAAKVCCC